MANARAIPIRCRWPPENSCGYRLRYSGRKPTTSINSATRFSRSFRIQERKRGQTLAKLEYQFLTCFEGFTSQDLENTVIEYEPIWAIGSGHVATPQQAGEAHQFIREMIKKYHSEETALKTRIIYGGSVKVKNVREMSEARDTDGVGIGSDSWDVQNFIKLAEICAQSVSKRKAA